MKERYVAPDMEIVEFETEDIITTSLATPEVPFAFVGTGYTVDSDM